LNIRELLDEEQELSKRLLVLRQQIDDLINDQLQELYEAMIHTEKPEEKK